MLSRVALIASVLVTAAIAPAPAAYAQLLVRYSFANTGSTVPNLGTLGAAATGLITGGVLIPGAGGPADRAMRFNGSSSYVSGGNDPRLNFGQGDFTVACVVRTTAVSTSSSFRFIVSKFYQGGNPGWYVAVRRNQNRPIMTVRQGSVVAEVTWPSRIDDGEWHVILAGRSAFTVWIAVDGGVPVTAPIPGAINVDNANPLLVADRAKIINNDGFIGDVDLVEVWGPSGPAAVPYPGSGEDLSLLVAVGGIGSPTASIHAAPPASFLTVRMTSPLGTFAQTPYALVGQLFPTGSPPSSPFGLPELHVNSSGAFVILPATTLPPFNLLPPAGIHLGVTVPPGLPQASLMLQGIASSSNAANGILASSDGHEVRF